MDISGQELNDWTYIKNVFPVRINSFLVSSIFDGAGKGVGLKVTSIDVNRVGFLKSVGRVYQILKSTKSDNFLSNFNDKNNILFLFTSRNLRN